MIFPLIVGKISDSPCFIPFKTESATFSGVESIQDSQLGKPSFLPFKIIPVFTKPGHTSIVRVGESFS